MIQIGVVATVQARLLPEHRKHLLIYSREECTQALLTEGFSATLLERYAEVLDHCTSPRHRTTRRATRDVLKLCFRASILGVDQLH